jgi:hypothetical protein
MRKGEEQDIMMSPPHSKIDDLATRAIASEAKPDTNGQSLFRPDQQSSPIGGDIPNFSASIDQPLAGV